jgi:hypothetical protein
MRIDSALYQIERPTIVNRLRGADVRVEKRLDGSLAVRFGERYLTVKPCAVAEKKKAPPVKPASARRQPASQHGSDWGKNFDLKKGPKIWPAAQESGHQRSVAKRSRISSPGFGGAARSKTPCMSATDRTPASAPAAIGRRSEVPASLIRVQFDCRYSVTMSLIFTSWPLRSILR